MNDSYDASLIQLIEPPNGLYPAIQHMRKRPALFLGSHSISALYHFTNGYLYACYVKGIDEVETPEWSKFHDFVCSRTGFAESTSGWCHMILSVNNHDEAKSLTMFFDLFEDFLKMGVKSSD